jgi:hypothetical protein
VAVLTLAESLVLGPNFKDWRAANHSFASLGMHGWGDFWLAARPSRLPSFDKRRLLPLECGHDYG